MSVLETLAESSRLRCERAKAVISRREIETLALAARSPDFAFEKSLKKPRLSFICEVKRASPSKGVISADFPYLEIARDYASAGADCVSVLTEPERFLGSDEYLREIAAAVPLPALRKDFTVDEYQIYEARALGAAAVLLICAISDGARLSAFASLARELGLTALVEAHDERECEAALRAGATVVGVNNRDLRTFEVSPANFARLRPYLPGGVTLVAESGFVTRADCVAAQEAGADAVLVGEALMRAPDRRAKLRELRSEP
ncbi:MAG: indole-3-glycerol phosphate synthase TrpC [Oscillospiraceae bacterium]|nr:indole-3-glycerol phosphate synthase TrpC [Oscillospiraceae bacterium]